MMDYYARFAFLDSDNDEHSTVIHFSAPVYKTAVLDAWRWINFRHECAPGYFAKLGYMEVGWYGELRPIAPDGSLDNAQQNTGFCWKEGTVRHNETFFDMADLPQPAIPFCTDPVIGGGP